MHFHWRSWKLRSFIFFLHNHVISLNSIHTTPKMVHAYFGPKPDLLAKYHIGSAYIIHCIWPLLTFDLHEGHSHPKLASAALLTKFGSYRELFIIMTFDLSVKGIIILNLYQQIFGLNLVDTAHCLLYLTSVDLWPPLRSPSS